MENNALNNPRKHFNKDNDFKTQCQTIFDYLKDKIATASMVAEATGVPQKNICRYKRDLEKSGQLWEVSRRNCELTGYKAWHITTNQDLAPNHQLKFDF